MQADEIIARALIERQIRRYRRWDTDPERLEQMMPAAVDYSWRDLEDDALAAIAALKASGFTIVLDEAQLLEKGEKLFKPVRSA